MLHWGGRRLVMNRSCYCNRLMMLMQLLLLLL